MDGTLLRSDGSVSTRTHDALARLTDAGIHLVLVTGRPARRVRDLAHALGVRGSVICGNGAVLYDLAEDRIVEQTRMSAELARELIQTLRAQIPEICFAVESGLAITREAAYYRLRHGADAALQQTADALELAAEGAIKLIAIHPDMPVDALLARVREIVRDRASVTHAGSPFLEIAAAGVTKAWALAAFCERLGIAAGEVLAFGDMPNDVPMLEWAGRAIAVANAHPTVLAVADEVAPSNEHDGVATVIERLLHV